MPAKPTVLILEKASFPPNIVLEECERLGKTEDQQDAIIRFQRPEAVGVLDRIRCFLSDLFNGVTLAKGELLKQPDNIPQTIHIRGMRWERNKSVNSNDGSGQPESPTTYRAASNAPDFGELKIIIRDSPEFEAGRRKALERTMERQLIERFEAHDCDGDLPAVDTFLELAAQTKPSLTGQQILRLMQFSDTLARLASSLKTELTKDVLEHVLQTLYRLQSEIREMGNAQPGGIPEYRYLKFKALEKDALERLGMRAAGPISSKMPAKIPPPEIPSRTPVGAPQYPPPPMPKKSEVKTVSPMSTSGTPTSSQVQDESPLPPAPPPPPPVLTAVSKQPENQTAQLDASSLESARTHLKSVQATGEAANSLNKPAVRSSSMPEASELEFMRAKLRPPPIKASVEAKSDDNDNSLGGILKRTMAVRGKSLNHPTDTGKNDRDDEEWLDDENSS